MVIRSLDCIGDECDEGNSGGKQRQSFGKPTLTSMTERRFGARKVSGNSGLNISSAVEKDVVLPVLGSVGPLA